MARIGKYELVRKLATGGMAEVFLAKAEWARGVERIVVVKRILAHLVEEPSFVEMFLSEARLASQLSHPNIVQIFEFGEDQGVYYLAMEYVDGPTVRALATRASEEGKPIPFSFCAKLISSACEALAYAHELTDAETGVPLQIVHRDISPDNILISRHGTVKVVDFGIAKAITQSHRTTTGIVKGKVAYMAPEQLKSTKSIDRRADVYALGVVLYELVSGAKPYDADSEITMAHAVLYEPVIPIRERRKDVPEELEKIVTKALAREREERYADCREMYTDLERYVMAVSREPLGAFQIAQMLVDLKVASVGPQVTPPPGMATPNRVAPAQQTPARREEAAPVPAQVVEPKVEAKTGTDDEDYGLTLRMLANALIPEAKGQSRQGEGETTRVERPPESIPSPPPAVPEPKPEVEPATVAVPVAAVDQEPVAEVPAPPREASKPGNWRIPVIAACALLILGVAFVGRWYWSPPQPPETVDPAKQEQAQQEQAKKAEEEAAKAKTEEEERKAAEEEAAKAKAEEERKAAEEEAAKAKAEEERKAAEAAAKAKVTEGARKAAEAAAKAKAAEDVARAEAAKKAAEDAARAEAAKKAAEDAARAEAAKKTAEDAARAEAEREAALAKPISLRVESDPQGATIRLTRDGHLVVEKASPVEVMLPSGTVKVEVLDHARQVCRLESVELKPGSDPVKQKFAAVSKLIINSVPWASVKVDGKELRETPVPVMVCAGAHTINLACSDGKGGMSGRGDVQEVTTRAGQTLAIKGRCQ